METFVAAAAFVENAAFSRQRRDALCGLGPEALDSPIVELVLGFAGLPYCFTLQSCRGHFVVDDDGDDHSLARLPDRPPADTVLYRIAYVAWCIDAGADGRRFRADLETVASSAPGLVQFGCATWFWERQVNSYVLQVEPERYAHLDCVRLEYPEALRVQSARDAFFDRLSSVLDGCRSRVRDR